MPRTKDSRARPHSRRDRSPDTSSSSSSDSSGDEGRGRGRRRRSRTRSRSPRRAGPPVPFRPLDEESVRRRALGRLVCDLCHVVADSEENMRKHLDGGPHFKELQGFREDLCRRNAETGMPRSVRDERDGVLPGMEVRQVDWALRYTKGGKGTKRDVQTIAAIKENNYSVAGERRGRGALDLGQYSYRRDDFYCDTCDVRVGTRNMMLSHMSGKEHMRRQKPTKRYYCHICRVDVSSEETLRAHEKGNSHIRKAHLIRREKERNDVEELEERFQRNDLDRTAPPEELGEAAKLREENDKLRRTNENLQSKVRELLEFKHGCTCQM